MRNTRNFAWAAGFLEGEGCFECDLHNGIRVSASQVQRWPLEYCERIFGGKIFIRKAWGNNKQQFRWAVMGTRAAGVMMTLYGFMSPKRKERMFSAVQQWISRPAANKYKTRCPLGHPYAGYNLITRPARRNCRECANIIKSRYYYRKKALIRSDPLQSELVISKQLGR